MWGLPNGECCEQEDRGWGSSQEKRVFQKKKKRGNRKPGKKETSPKGAAAREGINQTKRKTRGGKEIGKEKRGGRRKRGRTFEGKKN